MDEKVPAQGRKAQATTAAARMPSRSKSSSPRKAAAGRKSGRSENKISGEPRQIIILGMHRSGTSALTGVLARSGVFIGDDGALTGKNWENPQGFFERRDARNICDALLHGSDADWWKISSFDPDNADHVTVREQRPAISELIKALDSGGRNWALKEPRLCFLLPIFRSALSRPFAVIVYRHPLEVAKSLRRRNGFPIQAGLALWEAYTLSALRHGRELDHVMLGYDELLSDPVGALNRIDTALHARGGMRLDVEAGAEGVRPHLRRERMNAEESESFLSQSQKILWKMLSSDEKIATLPGLPGETIKVLREFEADEAERQFLRAETRRSAGEAKLAYELAEERSAEIKKKNEQVAELTRARDEAIAVQKRLEGELSDFENQIPRLKAELDRFSKREDDQRADIAYLKEKIDALEGERGQLMARRDALSDALSEKEKELSKRREELKRVSRELEQAKGKLNAAASERERLQRNIAAREAELTQSKEQLDAKRHQLEALGRERKALRERTAAEIQSREAAERACKRLHQEADSIRLALRERATSEESANQAVKNLKAEFIELRSGEQAKRERTKEAIQLLRREKEDALEKIEALQDTLDYFNDLHSVRVGRAIRRLLLNPFASRRESRMLNRAARIAAHPLFDAHWYRSRYEDVAASGSDPAFHYVSTGGQEGRAPHVLFDPDWYGRQVKIGAASTPLEHYLATPPEERLSPHPLFDSRWYLVQNPDVAEAGLDPLEHFLAAGGIEGRKPHPDFDVAWYLKQNTEVALVGINPLVHYLQVGAHEGREPNPNFSTAAYLRTNPDAVRSGINPLIHYVINGLKQS